uniref:Amino acid transporter transmembrane domain-containing protein n=1 Tax=Hyaloperonospora arabidopsidis (strain Emoy2) TaxID=559515 RepID=M4BKD0_HYAAE
MGSAGGERQCLLPSYSPVVHTRFPGQESATSWPSTFEEGLEARPYNERQRFLQQQQQREGLWSPATSSETIIAVQGTSSFKDAVFNAINVLLGVGVLSSPFSLRSSGWLIGMPLFLFFTLVTNHTAKLLGKCLDYQEGMTTYPDIGEAAFGTKGRVIIGITFFAELFTACAMFYVLIGDTLAALISSVTEIQVTIMAFLLIMPSMWTTHMSMLSYFSILGIFSSFFCFYAIFYVGLTIDTEAPGYETGSLLHPQPVQAIGDLDRIPLAIGLTMVAFGGHSVFPSICSSMANKDDYPRMLNFSYVIVGLVYAAIELAGYLMYGLATQKEITLNLIATYPGVLTQMVVWTIALNPMSKIAITLHPIALALEEFLLSPSQKRAAARDQPGKTLVFYRAFIRTILGMGALCCALFVPHFARVTSFLGAFFAMLVSVFLPCICYLKLFAHRLSKAEIMLNAGLAGLSIILMFFGTLASFLSPAD